MPEGSVVVSLSGDEAEAQKLLKSSRYLALEHAVAARTALDRASGIYEKAVLRAVELGCGYSEIGRRVGMSEAAIRGFVRRRRVRA